MAEITDSIKLKKYTNGTYLYETGHYARARWKGCVMYMFGSWHCYCRTAVNEWDCPHEEAVREVEKPTGKYVIIHGSDCIVVRPHAQVESRPLTTPSLSVDDLYGALE